MKRLHRFGALAICAAGLLGCSSDLGGEPREVMVDPQDSVSPRGTEQTSIGDIFEFNRPGSGVAGQALPVNKHLWRASLATLEFMPLASTDPFSGVIATDWSAAPDSPDERFKVTVYVTDTELQARSLRVAVFRELRGEDGAWTPAEVAEATPRRLEDAILTKARQMRVAALQTGED